MSGSADTRTPWSSAITGVERFQILSIDGGGAKGLFAAHILEQLDANLNRSISESFDLIVGTSAGGILALALGAGISPGEILEHFSSLLSDVFPDSWFNWGSRLQHLFMNRYRQDALKEALAKVFEARTLTESRTPLVIPSWDLGNNTPHLFKTPHAPYLVNDWKLPMVDIALATAAAPTFFPQMRVTGLRLVDGGVMANNPVMVGLAEAVGFGVPLTSIRVLSIGGPAHPFPIKKRYDRAGLIVWAPEIVDLMLQAHGEAAGKIATRLLTSDRYLRIDASDPTGREKFNKVTDSLEGYATNAARRHGSTVESVFGDHQPTLYTPLRP